MKERVEKGTDRLEKANIISPVKYSELAAPVVPLIKKKIPGFTYAETTRSRFIKLPTLKCIPCHELKNF